MTPSCPSWLSLLCSSRRKKLFLREEETNCTNSILDVTFVEVQFASKMFVFRIPFARVTRERLALRLLH